MEVRTLSEAGVQPLDIKTILNKQSDEPVHANLNTIYNEINAHRIEKLAGQSSIEYLIGQLKSLDFIYTIDQNDENQIQSLFFTLPQSIHLLKQFHSVILMDCTYKTNKFNMPLLHICGFTNTNHSFSVGFCFVTKENIPSYTWALLQLKNLLKGLVPEVIISDWDLALSKALKKTFPSSSHLLCIWHINKNVVAKCKKHFTSGDSWNAFYSKWQSLVESETESVSLIFEYIFHQPKRINISII